MEDLMSICPMSDFTVDQTFVYDPNAGTGFNVPMFSNMDMPIMAPVTDIFGFTRFCDPMSVDIMSGLPADAFPHTMADVIHEQNHAKLEESSNLHKEMDIAVEKYHDAMRSGDYDEALKWERIANDRQSSLYNLWDTPRYSPGPVRAPGL